MVFGHALPGQTTNSKSTPSRQSHLLRTRRRAQGIARGGAGAMLWRLQVVDIPRPQRDGRRIDGQAACLGPRNERLSVGERSCEVELRLKRAVHDLPEPTLMQPGSLLAGVLEAKRSNRKRHLAWTFQLCRTKAKHEHFPGILQD